MAEQAQHEYLEPCSNWGPWGADDQLGRLNLLSDEHKVAAARLVTTKRTVSCARELVTAFGDAATAAQMCWVVTCNRSTTAISPIAIF